MWRIFRFLGRFGNFILFLALEVAALLVTITVNKPQREISQGMFLEISGGLAEVQSSISGYFNLRSENEKLLDRLGSQEILIETLKDSLDVVLYRRPRNLNYMVVPDSIASDSCALLDFEALELPAGLMPVSSYKFIPAMAVNNSVDQNYNYITLNKGSRHGIIKDMGVISPDGIAGQVVGVSQNYSLALSLLNKKFRTGAKILHISNVGTLGWEGGNPTIARLDFIPQTSQIHIGDTVVTSGYSTVFPRDYMIGTVKEFNMETQDGFFQIKVKLATNFRGLNNLFLVKHNYQQEIDSLEKLKPNE
jgi:rod shape-determining protein MreC